MDTRTKPVITVNAESRGTRIKRFVMHNWRLWVLLLPAFVWLIVFCYAPMYGVQIAFKDYKVKMGITGSPWAGMKYFQQFFGTSIAVDSIVNTLLLSTYSLLWGFPIPIIFALLLNMLRNQKYKKFVQTISFAPHFVSTVVVVTMMNIMFAPTNGFVNTIIRSLGFEEILFMTRPEYFRSMYIGSGLWQDMGFNAIVYIAALAGVSPELHEAAIVDGASKFKRLIHIDIPCILPTVIIMFILSVGNLFSVGYEKAFLMQGSLNTSVSEIISTYVYKVGLQGAQYSFSAAVGLFNSVVNLIMLVAVNAISRKVSETSLF